MSLEPQSNRATPSPPVLRSTATPRPRTYLILQDRKQLRTTRVRTDLPIQQALRQVTLDPPLNPWRAASGKKELPPHRALELPTALRRRLEPGRNYLPWGI